MDEINKKVAEVTSSNFTTVTYTTWLKEPIENAYLNAENNIVLKADISFHLEILKVRYIDYLERVYKLFTNFNKIEFTIIEKDMKNNGVVNVEPFKLKTAAEMNKISHDFLSRKINIDETVKELLNEIFLGIEITAESGKFETVKQLCKELTNDEINNRVIDVLKKNGYIVKLSSHSDGNKFLTISWQQI
jgi:hypothetical protein